MSLTSQSPPERKQALVSAAVRVISQHGLRGLTHRAVDREAEVPLGSTSYHARTRKALLRMVVEWLVTMAAENAELTKRSSQAIMRVQLATTENEVTEAMSMLVDALSQNVEANRARYALLIEVDDDDLYQLLGPRSPLRAQVIAAFTEPFTKLGIANPEELAAQAFDMGDALVWQRTILGADPDVHGMIRAVVRGAPRA